MNRQIEGVVLVAIVWSLDIVENGECVCVGKFCILIIFYVVLNYGRMKYSVRKLNYYSFIN